MTLLEYQQAVCDAVAPALQPYGIECLAEDALDIDASIAAALAGVGCCAIVMTPELSYAGSDEHGGLVWEISSLIIAIREQVPLNRSRPGAATAIAAALLAVATLASDTITPLSIRQREEGGELLCEATLQTSQYITTITTTTTEA